METPAVQRVLDKQNGFFQAGVTRDLGYRIKALRQLRDAVRRREDDIMAALNRDLGRSAMEAYATEIGLVLSEISFAAKRLRRWAKPKKAKTALTHIGSSGTVVPEPYGSALIIAPWNYPFQLALTPLISALAAGNTAVVKPSELTPTVSALLAELIAETFDPAYVAVAEGGAEISAALLDLPFDYIFFTGSARVAKIVMAAAAKRLIPLTLELGGKSPCIVHRDADIALAARRIAFGKYTNAGQTRIAPDYLFVHRDVKEPLTDALAAAIREFYGDDPLESERYGSIVNDRHFRRLEEYMKDGRIIFGGATDEARLRIAPTLLDEVDADAPVMREEIFGPILPVLEYGEIDEVIRFVKSRPKPLALYLFTNDRGLQRQVTERISFGGGCINDTLMHAATPYLPFGGVGESGMGSYRGEHGFRTFSHYKTVLRQTNRFDLPFRYPNSKRGLSLLRKLLK